MNRLLSRALVYGGIAYFISKLLAFFLKAILARTGAYQFGLYFYTTETIRNTALLAAFGLPMSTSRYLGLFHKDKNKQAAIIQAAWTMLLSSSAFAVCLLAVIAPRLTADLQTGATNLLIIASLAVVGNAMVMLSKATAFGRTDPKTANIYEAADVSLKFLLTVTGLIFAAEPISGAIIGFTAASLIAGIITMIHTIKTANIKLQFKLSGQLFSYAWPVGVSETVTAACGISVMFILSRTSGAEGIGYYGAGMALSSLVFFVPQLVLPAFLPAITEKFASKESIRPDVALARIFISIPGIITAGIIILAIRPILLIIFGAQYLPAAITAVILVSAHALYVTLVWIPRQILDMTGKTKTNLVLTGIRSGVVLSLTWLLVPGMGVAGAAWAVLAGWTAEGLLAGILSKKALSYP